MSSLVVVYSGTEWRRSPALGMLAPAVLFAGARCGLLRMVVEATYETRMRDLRRLHDTLTATGWRAAISRTAGAPCSARKRDHQKALMIGYAPACR
ncbi:hypothetical protein ACFPOI_31325 [Nonomuraea angiospora]|uniref:Transposase n=1 Tax=Nonomuraea angiospora TaxID=46172 RepID=A0ABR9LNW4_9ACTN|nr:hypothetical protein [Nonomuraea angiospora]MBE1582333.1 hypothetical protein [Nonomuraea angiospora]